LAGATLAADVDFRGRVVAHEDDRQGRVDGPRAERADALGDRRLDLGGHDLAVEDLRHGGGPGQAGRSRWTRSIASARPDSGSIRITAPRNRARPRAGSTRFGMRVRKRWIASSGSTPITESRGPVRPRSVR